MLRPPGIKSAPFPVSFLNILVSPNPVYFYLPSKNSGNKMRFGIDYLKHVICTCPRQPTWFRIYLIRNQCGNIPRSTSISDINIRISCSCMYKYRYTHRNGSGNSSSNGSSSSGNNINVYLSNIRLNDICIYIMVLYFVMIEHVSFVEITFHYFRFFFRNSIISHFFGFLLMKNNLWNFSSV